MKYILTLSILLISIFNTGCIDSTSAAPSETETATANMVGEWTGGEKSTLVLQSNDKSYKTKALGRMIVNMYFNPTYKFNADGTYSMQGGNNGTMHVTSCSDRSKRNNVYRIRIWTEGAWSVRHMYDNTYYMKRTVTNGGIVISSARTTHDTFVPSDGSFFPKKGGGSVKIPRQVWDVVDVISLPCNDISAVPNAHMETFSSSRDEVHLGSSLDPGGDTQTFRRGSPKVSLNTAPDWWTTKK